MYKSVCMFLVVSMVSFITASEVTQPTVSKNQSLKIVSDSQLRLSKERLNEEEILSPVNHKIISTKERVFDQASKKDQDVYIKSSKPSSATYRQKLIEKKELENKRIVESGTKQQKAELLSKVHPFQQNQQNNKNQQKLSKTNKNKEQRLKIRINQQKQTKTKSMNEQIHPKDSGQGLIR